MEDTSFKSGVLDVRSEAEIESSIPFQEIVAGAAAVPWGEKPLGKWRKFPISNQNGSGSCMAQTLRKLAGIIVSLASGVYLDFSATDIYQRRVNKGSAGMGVDDLYAIGAQGITLDALMPSDAMGDTAMDAMVPSDQAIKVRALFQLGNPVFLPVGDIDAIASVINVTGKGVQLMMFWNVDEYGPVPLVLHPSLTSGQAEGVHSTAAVDFTLLGQTNVPNHPELWGKKALVMDESWDKIATTIDGQRLITEDFLKARNFCTTYPMNFKYQAGTVARPHHTFITSEVFKYDPKAPVSKDDNVVAIQDILKFEGYFPSNVDSTGYFGPLTQQKLMLWQKAHSIPATGVAAILTLTEMNRLYS